MEDQTQVNIPLLRKAVEWAEAEAAKPAIDREWWQNSWRTDAEEVAYQLLEDTPSEGWEMAEGAVGQVAPHCGTAYCIAGYVGQLLDARYAASHVVDDVHVSDFAASALGITNGTGARSLPLFARHNTAADVRRIAEDIAGERL